MAMHQWHYLSMDLGVLSICEYHVLISPPASVGATE
jgi:hypothetical protein